MTRSKIAVLGTLPLFGSAFRLAPSYFPQRTHDETGHLQIEVPATTGDALISVLGKFDSDALEPWYTVLSRQISVDYPTTPSSELILNVDLFPIMAISHLRVGGPVAESWTAYIME